MVLPIASFRKVKVGFEVLVFLNLRYLPDPPNLPSMVTRFAPSSLIIPFATAPEIIFSDASPG